MKDSNEKGYYCYEINVTNSCNFRCSYCFEGDMCSKTDSIEPHADRVIETINIIRNDEWFNEKFGGLHITFWGGEPTLSPRFLKRIIDEYKDEDNVKYHIYTNGSNPNVILDVFECVKDKLDIQVSYDGQPVHDMNRVDVSGSPTSVQVLECLHILKNASFNVHIKSSIRPDNFQHLSDAWDDVYNLNKEYGYSLSFAPSIDYSNPYENDHVEELKESLLKICKKEVAYIKEHGKPLLRWFDSGVVTCSFPSAGVFIDVDGKMKYCHGCGYTTDENLSFGSIYDEDFLSKMRSVNEGIKCERGVECDVCSAQVCYSCNSSKYINSTREDFMDRWNDHSCQPYLCNYFKIITKYLEATKRAVGKGEKNGV